MFRVGVAQPTVRYKSPSHKHFTYVLFELHMSILRSLLVVVEETSWKSVRLVGLIKISDRGNFMSGTSTLDVSLTLFGRKVTITGPQRAIRAAEAMISQKEEATAEIEEKPAVPAEVEVDSKDFVESRRRNRQVQMQSQVVLGSFEACVTCQARGFQEFGAQELFGSGVGY
ncbi:hypothetical protein TEA_027177 [Camellia sinensis var. sinensis]|uniref:Uncharacterized protein n=1 Tax=Camellia sinensis var. sinensis TaxID=542762 RepID=A0A4S4E9B2_CAMSN|nr:hypothetical protein TEA_027177 [Camellia sinensis var. sinensis]